MDEAPKPPVAPAAPTAMPQSDAEMNKWYGVLAYCSILFLIPLLAARQSPFAQHHAKQGMVLFLTGLVIFFVSPFLPELIASLLNDIGNLVIFILAILGIIHAWKGDMWVMPVFGDLAKKINV